MVSIHSSPVGRLCSKINVRQADLPLTLTALHLRMFPHSFPFNWTWFLDVSQVVAKRTNRPGISTTDRGFPRARFRSRGGSFPSRARYYSGYTPPRGRGRAFRWADARHITVGELCWSYKSYQQLWYRGKVQHFWSRMLNYESCLTLSFLFNNKNRTRYNMDWFHT